MSDTLLIFLVLAAGTWLSTSVGAAMIAFVKKGSGTITTLILGFAAGVILMVSFVELIHPAIHQAETYASLPAWLVVPVAFAGGFLGTLLFDMYINHLSKKRESEGGDNFKYKQGLLLLATLSSHNIPEGLALGILLGAVGAVNGEELIAIMPIVVAIGLHKIPEGTAIAVAFQKEGMTKLKSFFLGQMSGFMGFLSGLVSFRVATSFDAVLPYAMAFAGGAMVWVVVHELIPESNRNRKKSPYLATVGVLLGVVLMLFVDITLHNHGHSHDCCHGHGAVCGVHHHR